MDMRLNQLKVGESVSDSNVNVQIEGTIDESSYKCPYCDKKFKQHQTMKYHVGAGVCMGTLFCCKRCLSVFCQPWMLKRHQEQTNKCDKRNTVAIQKIGDKIKCFPVSIEE